MTSRANVMELVKEVLATDPVPFERVNLNSNDAIEFIGNSIWERYCTEWCVVDKNKTEELMLAILIKTLAENFYLHTKLIMLGEEDR
jgi:hypothetical protein